jgi:hypothetical protein
MVKKQVPALFQGGLMAFTAVKQQFGQIQARAYKSLSPSMRGNPGFGSAKTFRSPPRRSTR